MALRQRKSKTEAGSELEVEPVGQQEEVMSLYQQRLRTAMEAKVRSDSQENLTPSELNKKVEEGLTKMFEPKQAPLPGLTHETKASKDALTQDPYNLQLIFDLGSGYMKEEKYKEATNVLIRGWKRMSEIKEPEHRFEFLMKLCGASNECGMYKQAEAVILDIEDQDDIRLRLDLCRMSTKVYANNNNLQKALKAFHRGLENCTSVEEAMPLWYDTIGSLKKVGAYEAARSAIEQLATDDTDKQKLSVMESFSDMRATMNASAIKPLFPRKVMLGFLVVLLCFLVYLLHLLESRSLKSLKLTK